MYFTRFMFCAFPRKQTSLLYVDLCHFPLILLHVTALFSEQAAATVKDGKRILFQFDKAAFSFKFLPFKVPYPVPFRLLGDEAKGWLDTTYLSHNGSIRISRGNKVFFLISCESTVADQYLSRAWLRLLTLFTCAPAYRFLFQCATSA